MSIEIVRQDKGKDLTVKVSVTVPADEMNAARNVKLSEWAKRAKLPGFRPGRVPMQVIRQRYEAAAHGELLQTKVQETYEAALKQLNVEPVARPEINVLKSEVGEPLEYEATFEQYPTVELADFTHCSVKLPVAVIDDEQLQKAIEKVREEHRVFEAVESPAQTGDQVTIDFEGRLNGEVFEGGVASNHSFVLGQGRMLEDFESPILGKSAGDTLEFPMTFPKDYHQAALAGQSVEFAVKIHSVASGTLPELDEAFFKQLNLEPATLETFEDEVRKPLQAQLDDQIRALTKRRVFDVLTSKHKLLLPTVLVEDMVKQLSSSKNTTEPLSKKEEKNLRKEAENQVALGLILRKIIEVENIQLDESRVDQMIQSLASPYMDSTAFVQWYREDKNRMNNIRSRVLEDQVLDWIVDQMKTKDDSMTSEKVSELLAKE